MDSLEQQIEQLEAEVAEQESQLIELEMETAELETELDEFSRRYQNTVSPIQTRLQAAKSALADMERHVRLKRMGYEPPPENLWNDAFPKTPPSSNRTPPDDTPIQPRRTATEKADRTTRLKQLFRALARRFHPDLGHDDSDREERTRLMTMINDAYRKGDLEALIELDKDATLADNINHLTKTNVSFTMMRLRELEQKRSQLLYLIADQKTRRDGLLYGEMMSMRLEDSLSRSKGRNFLQEIAASMEEEYLAVMEQLESLRQQL